MLPKSSQYFMDHHNTSLSSYITIMISSLSALARSDRHTLIRRDATKTAPALFSLLTVDNAQWHVTAKLLVYVGVVMR